MDRKENKRKTDDRGSLHCLGRRLRAAKRRLRYYQKAGATKTRKPQGEGMQAARDDIHALTRQIEKGST